MSRSAALAALVSLVCAGGCQVAQAKLYNLDELHEENGRHKYVAALEGDWEYLTRLAMAGIFKSVGATFKDKSPSKVEDPTESCLENIVGLAAGDSSDPNLAAAQVETFAKIAVADVWKLSRERAIVELGHAGRRLELATHPVEASSGAPASIDAVRDAITDLVASVAGVLGKPSSDRPIKDLPTAIAAARALPFDVQGGARLLRSVRLLAARAGHSGTLLAEFSLELQRRLISMALHQAAEDRNEIPRAAAVGAGCEAFGSHWLLEWQSARKAGFRSEDDEVLVALGDEIARHGLPRATSDADQHALEVLTETTYQIAVYHPEGRVRAAGMRALATVSGGAVRGLHEEDWQTWWMSTHPNATARPAPPAATPPTESAPSKP